jgi:hypothetical protein
LKFIYRPFCAIQNRILVEYKKFFQYLLSSLAELDDEYSALLQSPGIVGKVSPAKKPDMKRSKSTTVNNF